MQDGDYIAKLIVESEVQKRFESQAPPVAEGEEPLHVLNPKGVRKLALAKMDLQIVELAIKSLHNLLVNAYNKSGPRYVFVSDCV